MCNLNILLQRKSNKNKVSFLSSVTSNSYAFNNDGDGIALNNEVIKSEKKLNYFKLAPKIMREDLILSHQRITTSGHAPEFLQPFCSDEFIFMHNGVISSYVLNNKSDTYNLFEKFKTEFLTAPDQTREKKIITAIKNIFDKLSGTFSICIKDLKTNQVYYFKNDRTKIYAFLSNNSLYLTTEKSNQSFLSLLEESFKKIEVEDHVIYNIAPDGLKKLSELEESITIIKKNNYSDFYTWADKKPNTKKSKKQRKKERRAKAKEEQKQKEKEKAQDKYLSIEEEDLIDKEVTNALGDLTYNEKNAYKCILCKFKTPYHSEIYEAPLCLDCYEVMRKSTEDYYTEQYLKNRAKD